MEVEQPRVENQAMTFDEASMEQSKGFVKALQVLSLFDLVQVHVYLNVHFATA